LEIEKLNAQNREPSRRLNLQCRFCAEKRAKDPGGIIVCHAHGGQSHSSPGGGELCAINLTNLLPEGEPLEHLTENDRIMIASFLDNGMEVKEIARMLKRDRTTICRKIKGRRRKTFENRNGTLRRILEKGTSFNELTQEEELNVIVSHANGLHRKEHGDRTAMEMFMEDFGKRTAITLGLQVIADRDICLLPKLLEKIRPADD